MPSRSHLPLVLFLYTSQYLGIGFLYFGLNAILRSHGVELEKLAAVSALGLLWVAKALWAPIIDRFSVLPGGHYRGWLLILQPLVALSLLALLPFDQPHNSLGPVLAVIGVYVTVSATQDIATDAVVARYISANNQGWANATAVIGSWLGNVFGGGGALLIYDAFGWQAAIAFLAGLSALPLALVWRFQEPDAVVRIDLAARYRNMGKLLTLPMRRSWLLAAHSSFWLTGVAAYGLITPALVDAGWSLTKVGIVMGFAMSIPAMAGASLAGWAARAVGMRKLFVASGVLVGLTSPILAVALSQSVSDTIRIVGLAAYVLAMSAVSTSIYTMHMALSRRDFAGTDFTTLTCIGTLWTTVGGFVALTLAASVGYGITAIGFGAVCSVGGFIAASIYRKAEGAGELRMDSDESLAFASDGTYNAHT